VRSASDADIANHDNRNAVASYRGMWDCITRPDAAYPFALDVPPQIRPTATRLRHIAQGRGGAAHPGYAPRAPPTTGGTLKGFRRQRAWPLIPHVPFVVFDLVSFQEGPEFLLEVEFPMMFFLSPDVLAYLIDIGLADRKRPVTGLPLKFGRSRVEVLDPSRSDALQFFHPISEADGSRLTSQNVHVILRPTHND